MSSEQVWDSLVTLVAKSPDKLAKRTFSDTIYYEGRPRFVEEMTMVDLSEKVLAIKSPEKYKNFLDEMLVKLSAEKISASSSMEMGMSGAKKMGGMKRKKKNKTPRFVGNGAMHYEAAKGIARASELRTPAPDGHLLGAFGQSNRGIVNGAIKEANLAQVLEVLNGHVEEMVVSNRSAAVYEALKLGATDADKVRYIYYAILSRPPTSDELNMLMRDVIDGSRESYQNLVSALVATHEFIFIQ